MASALKSAVDRVENAARPLVDRLLGHDTFEPPAAAAPLPQGNPDPFYDGGIVGAGGSVYPPSALGNVPPILPSDGRAPTQSVLFVNGAGAVHADVARECQEIADATGSAVVGLDNASNGGVLDVVQALEDFARLDRNPATVSLTRIIEDHLQRGEPLHLMAHSQGAIIVANALQDAHDDLKAQGWTDAQLSARLSLFQVETFAGGAHHYVDGPQYVHYVNREDVVPMTAGVGLLPCGSPGAGAKVVRFDDFRPLDFVLNDHVLSTYLQHWRPFDDVYGG